MIFFSVVINPMKNLLTFILSGLLLIQQQTSAQDNLDSLLNGDEAKKINYSFATFGGTRIINGQSIENVPAGALQLIFSHRFGEVNGGIHTFYGLDQANVRLGFDYGITGRLTAGIGRSNQKETYDGYLKYKLLRQSSGARVMPVSVSLYGNAAVMTNKKSNLDTISNLSSRLFFAYQLIIARKFNSRLSLQFMPTLVYRNQIQSLQDQYYTASLGFAGRYKFSKRMAVTGEYFYLLPGYRADHYYNSASLGIDIETGGHIFQLHLTNSQGMIEQFYIPQTEGNWLKQGVRIGFNVVRVFTLDHKRKEIKSRW
jgi:hypothetical protein